MRLGRHIHLINIQDRPSDDDTPLDDTRSHVSVEDALLVSDIGDIERQMGLNAQEEDDAMSYEAPGPSSGSVSGVCSMLCITFKADRLRSHLRTRTTHPFFFPDSPCSRHRRALRSKY